MVWRSLPISRGARGRKFPREIGRLRQTSCESQRLRRIPYRLSLKPSTGPSLSPYPNLCLLSRRRCARTSIDHFTTAVHLYGESWASTRACRQRTTHMCIRRARAWGIRRVGVAVCANTLAIVMTQHSRLKQFGGFWTDTTLCRQ